MALPNNLGRLAAGLTADASLNIGVGVTPSGTFRFEVGTTSKFTGVATFGSTLSNGTYTYTLPSATGTLALTSALSGYLPLTGGTLTGALGGTSATFNATAVSPITSINTSGREIGIFQTSINGGFMTFQSSGANTRGYIGNGAGISSLSESTFGIRSESDLVLMSGGNNPRLTIASTGAATFSSSITADNSTFATAGGGLSQTTIGKTSGGYAGLRLAVDAGFYSWIIGAQYNVGNAFEITPSTVVGGSTFTTPVFKILNTGAATFSSSVGTTALNMNNMSALGSVGGGSIFMPSTAAIAFRSANGSVGYGNIKANTSGGILLNSGGEGNVGIDTDATTAKLGIGRTANTESNIFLTRSTTTADVNIGCIRAALGPFWYDATSTSLAEINLQTDTTAYFKGAIMFSTNNSDATSNRAVLRMYINAAGSIGTTKNGTNIYNASDVRLKRNIETIELGLDKILQLNPVKFNWVDGFAEDGKDMLGFIAQEVKGIIPEAVEDFGGENNIVEIGDLKVSNPLRINEKFIIPVLVKAIQELSAQIKELQSQIKK